MKKLLATSLAAFAMFSCSADNTASEVKGNSFPQQLSCYMSLELDSKSYSCNDFQVNTEQEKKTIAALCTFAASDELGNKLYDLRVVENQACDKEKVTSKCMVENNTTFEPVPTYYYTINERDEELAKESCEDMDGGTFSKL